MTQTADHRGNALFYTAGVGTNDNDVVFQTGDISAYDTFELQSTAGAMDVQVSLDGTNYGASPIAMQALSATDNIPVLLTAAGGTYGFRGKFAKIKVSQNGATGVTAGCLVCGKI